MEYPPYHCPRCGERRLQRPQVNQLHCESCNFLYFHNTAAAVGAVILDGDRMLVGIRGREPAKGKLDLPGGFVDPGETLEDAMSRELEEELGQRPISMRYLTSAPNTYPYREVTYTTCDTFFVCEFEDLSKLKAADDIESLAWVSLAETDPQDCAFESTREIFRLLREHVGGNGI